MSFLQYKPFENMLLIDFLVIFEAKDVINQVLYLDKYNNRITIFKF